MGTGDRSIESNHISSLTRVERDPYHGHSYKPKPSFMLLILKPWLDPKLLCTQARILLPVEMMLLRLMIDWGYCHVIHTIDKITGSLVMSIVSWKLCPIGYMNHEIVLLATCKLIAANMRVIASQLSTSFVAVIASQRTRACALLSGSSSSSQKFKRLHIILLSTTHESPQHYKALWSLSIRLMWS